MRKTVKLFPKNSETFQKIFRLPKIEGKNRFFNNKR